MNKDEFKDLLRDSWDEDFIFLHIDRPKKKNKGVFYIPSESKNTYIKGTSETKPF